MNSYSGICVIAHPGALAAAQADLAELEGTEVYASDPGQAKIIVVQEGSSLEDHEDGLRRIRDLPSVLTADLVYHFIDSDGQPTEAAVQNHV